MDRKRNIGNRNRPQGSQRTRKGLSGRRARLDRRNRRQGLRPNRNRLSRVQNNVSRNRRGVFRNRRGFNNFRRRRNLRYKIIFVGNLPFDVTSRRLRQLFRGEGRIFEATIVRGRYGSKGYGFVEFFNSRDAWRSIQKWDKTTLGGRTITVEYGRGRRFRNNNNRRFNNYNNYQNQRFNQPRPFGFRPRGSRGGFRPRGGRY